MIVVGLTGGIGTGKSTVARFLSDAGVPVIDADRVAREVVEPGQPALVQIAEAFGPDVLDPTGALDRAAMRQRISHDADARRTLEQITHPAIGASILERLAKLQAEGTAAAIVEAALMVETGTYRRYGALVVVTCSPAVQLARVMSRDQVSEADAKALIASQMSLADKEAVANYVIRNDDTLEALAEETARVWATLRAELTSPSP